MVVLLLLGGELEAPARLYRGPVDWNGDGKPDLLVGDFHDHRVPGRQGNEHMHGWVWLYLPK